MSREVAIGVPSTIDCHGVDVHDVHEHLVVDQAPSSKIFAPTKSVLQPETTYCMIPFHDEWQTTTMEQKE